MNKKTLGLLKIAYAKVMSIPPVEMASDIYKDRRRAKTVKRYNVHLSSLYDNLPASDINLTTFSPVDLDFRPDSACAAGFDILGYCKETDSEKAAELTAMLSAVPEDEDIALRLAITDSSENAEKLNSLVPDGLKLYFLSERKSYLFNMGGFRLAAVGITLSPDNLNNGKIRISGQALTNIAYARENADYTLVYALNRCDKGYDKTIMRYLVSLGADYVFATDTESVRAGVPVRRLDGRYIHTCPSTGSIPFGTSYGCSPWVVLRHKLIQAPGSGEFLLNRCFLPMLSCCVEGVIKTSSLMTYDSCKDEPDMLEAYKTIVTGCTGYHHIDDVMTIGDICRIVGAELPAEYAYMEHVSVGKITTHWPDSEKGDVLFFNEPYRDVNDVIDKPLKVRLLVVEKALEKGVCFVFSHVPLDPAVPHVVLTSPMEAHIKLCAHIRSKYTLKTIGITGSIGKTSTKDMLYNVLKQHYDTDRNLRNTNTQVNIGLHIQSFRPWQEIYIQEIGGGRKGGASRHSRMILPDAACVTNIGDAHIGNHGSREALMLNKLGITDGLTPDGVLYLNGDDPLLSVAKVEADTVYYAVHNKNADYFADNVIQSDGQIHFDVCHGDSRTPVVLNVPGEHNVLNAVCCFAIARQFGLTDSEIQTGLAEFRTSGVRQNFVNIDGYRLFVDCFNASPDSIDSALSVLDSLKMESGKKIAVVGDVTGMAGMAKDVHKKIGEIVTGHAMDILVCYGKNSKEVYKIATAKGFNAYSFTKPADLIAFLKKNMAPGDVVLFKGSSKMKLAQIIDRMFGTMFAEQMYSDSAKSKNVSVDGIDYNVCPAFATVKGCSSVSDRIVLGDKVKGKTLRNIDAEAFMGNSFAESITLGSGVRHIGDRAFADCPKLKDIYLPDALMYIGEDAFAGCPQLTIHCKEGSQTHELCRSRGIKTN